MTIKTADICDEHADRVHIADPIFRAYGGRPAFGGPITTLRVFEDNVLVRSALEEPGDGRVLVVDGAASMRCALLGDQLAALAADNGWAGVVVNGCIRDSADIAGIDIGVRALATMPLKSRKLGRGERDVTVAFAGVAFEPGHHLYADEDGLLVSADALV
ncbi:ribonuclease E activity regulator RraA [Lentisalinibacter orientalis]|uniref:ribonuclease E activity regulator RraA n=1 Tax=Lentisalinibacter orientalis TaxID=2992241 RepID=UPI003868478E